MTIFQVIPRTDATPKELKALAAAIKSFQVAYAGDKPWLAIDLSGMEELKAGIFPPTIGGLAVFQDLCETAEERSCRPVLIQVEDESIDDDDSLWSSRAAPMMRQHITEHLVEAIKVLPGSPSLWGGRLPP
jgi:hypothetical protein